MNRSKWRMQARKKLLSFPRGRSFYVYVSSAANSSYSVKLWSRKYVTYWNHPWGSMRTYLTFLSSHQKWRAQFNISEITHPSRYDFPYWTKKMEATRLASCGRYWPSPFARGHALFHWTPSVRCPWGFLKILYFTLMSNTATCMRVFTCMAVACCMG